MMIECGVLACAKRGCELGLRVKISKREAGSVGAAPNNLCSFLWNFYLKIVL